MVNSVFFLQGRNLKKFFGLLSFLSVLWFGWLLPSLANAATATTTTLVVTPSNSLAAQQIVTLTASVQTGGQPVTAGTVNFFDGKLYLGSIQVVRDPSHGYAVGTATVKTALTIGTHSIIATFQPTAALASSTSTSHTITVGGAGATNITLSSAAGSGNNTSLTATLLGFGASKPTGSVLFSNQTSGAALGTVAVDPTAFTNTFFPETSFAASQPTLVYTLDVNGDGFPDALVIEDQDFNGTNLGVFISDGKGAFDGSECSFCQGPGYPKGGFSPPAVADYNGDGVPDLAFASNTSPPPVGETAYEAIVLLGAGDGTFPKGETLIPAPAYPSTLKLSFAASGDFNGDGIPDLTVTDTTSPTSPVLYIFPGNGDGTFGTPILQPAMVGVTSLVVQDFNRDGYADMALTLGDQNAVLVLLGKGDGTFQPAVSYPVGTNPVISAILQSRGNGISDLAVLNQTALAGGMGFTSDSFEMLIGNGDGTFLPQVTYPLKTTGEAVRQFVAADFTGDGVQDLAELYYPDPLSVVESVDVFAGVGDGTYLQPYSFSLPLSPTAIAAADFNRDGVADLIATNAGDYTVGILTSGLQENVPLTATVYGTGTQQLMAKYSGDANYGSSTSNSISVAGQGAPPPPTFTVAVNPSSISIVAGKTGTATLRVTPQNGFSSAVTFSCSGVPANSSCSFSPSSVTPNGAAVTTTLTLATDVQAAVKVPANTLRGAMISFALLAGFVPFAGIRFARKGWGLSPNRDRYPIFLFFAGSVALAATLVLGCSGSNGSTTPTPPTTPVGTTSVSVKAIGSGSSGTAVTTALTVTVTN